MIITMRHIREANYCARGARLFCANHGIDWSDFVKNGIDESELEGIDDAMLATVIEVARGQQ